VRKIIEQLPGRYKILNFFCDWPVHSAMDRGAAREIITTFDEYLASNVLTNAPLALQMLNAVSRLISLKGFTHDLFVFLGDQGLDTSLVGNPDRLGPFLSTYVDIVARTPLMVRHNARKNLDQIEIRKQTTTKNQPTVLGERFVFGIEWLFSQGGVIQMNMFNEIWFPPEPRSVRTTIRKLVFKEGQAWFQPQESQLFCDKS
jgi:hypothetical protein